MLTIAVDKAEMVPLLLMLPKITLERFPRISLLLQSLPLLLLLTAVLLVLMSPILLLLATQLLLLLSFGRAILPQHRQQKVWPFACSNCGTNWKAVGQMWRGLESRQRSQVKIVVEAYFVGECLAFAIEIGIKWPSVSL